MAKRVVIETVAQVLAAWPDCPPIAGRNETVRADGKGDLFLQVQFPVSNNDRTTHSLSFVEEGGARILINAPVGAGDASTIEMGEAIGALFRAKKINGVEFKAPSTPLMHDDNENGLYFKTSVVIPYVYHYDDAEPA